MNNRLPIKVYYCICTLRHIRIEMSFNMGWRILVNFIPRLIYAAKFEQTIIHQHVHLQRESQSHAPAHVLMRLYPIGKSVVCLQSERRMFNCHIPLIIWLKGTTDKNKCTETFCSIWVGRKVYYAEYALYSKRSPMGEGFLYSKSSGGLIYYGGRFTPQIWVKWWT
jgi:hypothetical protein